MERMGFEPTTSCVQGRFRTLVSASLCGFQGFNADQRQPALVGVVTACVTAARLT